jgi:hypothetical protein
VEVPRCTVKAPSPVPSYYRGSGKPSVPRLDIIRGKSYRHVVSDNDAAHKRSVHNDDDSGLPRYLMLNHAHGRTQVQQIHCWLVRLTGMSGHRLCSGSNLRQPPIFSRSSRPRLCSDHRKALENVRSYDDTTIYVDAALFGLCCYYFWKSR